MPKQSKTYKIENREPFYVLPVLSLLLFLTPPRHGSSRIPGITVVQYLSSVSAYLLIVLNKAVLRDFVPFIFFFRQSLPKS